MSTHESKKQQERLELGKKLQAFYESGYVSKKQALLFTFVKGVVGGAGAFIGGTLIIALVIWILSRFSALPFIGHLVMTIRQQLHK